MLFCFVVVVVLHVVISFKFLCEMQELLAPPLLLRCVRFLLVVVGLSGVFDVTSTLKIGKTHFGPKKREFVVCPPCTRLQVMLEPLRSTHKFWLFVPPFFTRSL